MNEWMNDNHRWIILSGRSVFHSKPSQNIYQKIGFYKKKIEYLLSACEKKPKLIVTLLLNEMYFIYAIIEISNLHSFKWVKR